MGQWKGHRARTELLPDLLMIDLDSPSCLHLNFFTSQREGIHRKLPALSAVDPSLSNIQLQSVAFSVLWPGQG